MESDIKAYESELLQLKEISASEGSGLWSVVTLGMGPSGAASERAKTLFTKMAKAVEKVAKLEKEVESSKKLLSVGA